MTDETDKAFELLMRKHAETEAKVIALADVVAVIASRLARESSDTEAFILTLAANLAHLAEGFDGTDPLGQAAAAAILEFQSEFEAGVRKRAQA